ncbi:MAG TPA: type II toxin-antitoxin system PemK/MazF family toxin [Chthoniobacterales bacterium]|nr:type II toxin-antitoxin system PemK/MazF family toxin [Chthoniobacterales bacterium]
MPFERGDVVLVLFPNSDLRTAKRRPALVVQANNLETGLPQIIIAMISSNLARADHPSRVRLERGASGFRESGLLTDSVVMTDNLATVLRAEIHKGIGRFSQMEDVDTALRHTLGM